MRRPSIYENYTYKMLFKAICTFVGLTLAVILIGYAFR